MDKKAVTEFYYSERKEERERDRERRLNKKKHKKKSCTLKRAESIQGRTLQTWISIATKSKCNEKNCGYSKVEPSQM